MGFFEAASNVVGLPGSMVRDVIGGENPFDQLLDPFGEEDRLTITESTGLEGIPGFLAEMLLDPLNLLAGVGVAKGLPKLLKARKAAKGSKALFRRVAKRSADRRRAGQASGLTRRKKRVAKKLWGTSDKGQAAGVTEELAKLAGLTLRGPKGPGMLSRVKGGIAAGGRGLRGRAKHGWRQFRRLPRYSQAVIGPKALGGLERGLFGDEEESIGIEEILNNPELMEIIMQQALLGGDAGTNEPLNMASPLDMLDINSPEPEFSGPFVGRQTDPFGPSPISAPDLRDEYSAPSLQSGLFLEDNPFGL